jgi:hypothetical protein
LVCGALFLTVSRQMAGMQVRHLALSDALTEW